MANHHTPEGPRQPWSKDMAWTVLAFGFLVVAVAVWMAVFGDTAQKAQVRTVIVAGGGFVAMAMGVRVLPGGH
jgi:hypothetical protein